MRKIIFIIILLFSVGCNSDIAKNRKGAEINDMSNEYEEVCINSHIYYYGYRRLAPKMSDNGMPVKCEKVKGLK